MENLPSTRSDRKSLRRILPISLWALFAICATWASFELDEPVRQAVVQTQGKGWKKTDDFRFKTAVRRVGDWPWLMLAGGIGLAISWKIRSREGMRIVAAAMIASTLAGLLANASRLTTGRTRPRESPAITQGFYGPWREGRLTIGDPPFNSFPSGHTATAFGFAGVILFARPWLGVGAIALASLIAWSSIMVGAHHVSDVVVSICLSLFVAWWTFKWAQAHGEAHARRVWVRLKELWRAHRGG
ncbi:MAG TPA: phosphatase PAP2 family protein [Terrimicrobiaceae bacterium]|nr:phosphatase PAP2 family protein [Terrimicrobiaceae bacterium]